MYEESPFKDILQQTDAHIHSQARIAISYAINQVLSQTDIILLNAMGVDGKRKILDVFIEECETLKRSE